MALIRGPGSSLAGTGDLSDISARTRLLVVAPHPDDETIATGLLVQQVREAGGEVGIVLLTLGDNNPWPQRWLERRLRVGAAGRRRWGHRRLDEMGQAMTRLGLQPHALQSLGWPDMGVTDVLLHSTGPAIAALGAAIDRFAPDLIAFPDLADRHPDHGAAHVLVRLALAGRSDPPRLLPYLVHGPAGQGTRIGVAGTPAQAATKLAALGAHRSQMALSGRRMHRLAARPERYGVVAPVADSGAPTLLPWQPHAWMHPWLQLSVASPVATRTWRWRDAPLRRDAEGRFHLVPQDGAGDPCFARLASTLPTPWIFDHWGWCEMHGMALAPAG